MSALAERRKQRAKDGRAKFWADVPFTKAPASASGDIELSGYASTYGLDRDEEMVQPGAFDKSLGAYLSKNPILLWQHNMDWPIGQVTGAHTDDTGLYITARVPNPGPDAADWQKGAYVAIKNGIVRTFSIGGFMTRDVKMGPDGPVFVIVEVELYEISTVSIPANAESIYDAAVKAISGEPPRLSDKATAQMEELLGFKALTDPELKGMTPEAREARYGELSAMFERAHGVAPPGYDDWRKVGVAIEAGVSPIKTAEATTMVARAFYSPVLPEEKAGRAISAANRSKLEDALGAHDTMAEHMVSAADGLKAAAAAHTDAVAAIKGVLGIDDSEPDPDEDPEDDEPPNSPEKAAPRATARFKQLASEIRSSVQSAAVERYGQAPVGQQYGPSVYVIDLDLDEGFAIVDVWSPNEERTLRVPILRGADGSVALGEGEQEVQPVMSYRPKAAGGAKAYEPQPYSRDDDETVECPECGKYNSPDAVYCDQCGYKLEGSDDVQAAKAKALAGECPECGAPVPEGARTCVNDDCDWTMSEENPPKAAAARDVKGASEVDPDATVEAIPEEANMLARADFYAELHRAAADLKAAGVVPDAKGALSAANLPIADRDRAWDNGAAKGRVHDWAQKPDGTYDAAKLAKAYLWRDDGADAAQVTSYRFIVADLIDGTLTYVPRAIFAAGNVVQGGRGGTSDQIASAIKPALEKLYAKMATKFGDDTIKPPWSES